MGSAAFAQPAGSFNPVIAPVEKALTRVSLGPVVSAGAAAIPGGGGGTFSVGLGASVFDLWGVADVACEARQAKERAALGGDKVKAWGRVLERAQQPCRLLEQGWRPAYDFGAELGLTQPLFGSSGNGARAGRVGHLRAWFAPVDVWRLTLGLSASGLVGEDADGGSAVGLRLGPELAWHHRFGGFEGRGARHVFSAVLRPEVSLLRTQALPHQVTLGARFLFDL